MFLSCVLFMLHVAEFNKNHNGQAMLLAKNISRIHNSFEQDGSWEDSGTTISGIQGLHQNSTRVTMPVLFDSGSELIAD